MIIKGLIDEDFINYKKPCMTIIFPYCSFKCDKECGQPVCQNGALVNSPTIEVDNEKIVERYLNNPITEAIVFQGLEPFDSFDDMLALIMYFRLKTDDDIVIYTGYKKEEINPEIKAIKRYGEKNILIKFGRFIPKQKHHYDELLGVELASANQYAERIV